jgi:mannose-6-phosphate isomerase-like protein (cupin superfamily)
MEYSRRDLSLLLPVLLAAASHAVAEEGPLPSKAYDFTSLPVKTNPKNHNQTRQVFKGQTYQGVPIDLHITTLMPREMPHPPHRHTHEELMLIQQGTLEFTISGQTSRVGPGSVVFIHSQDLHGLKNVGDAPAQYFVLAVGNLNS